MGTEAGMNMNRGKLGHRNFDEWCEFVSEDWPKRDAWRLKHEALGSQQFLDSAGSFGFANRDLIESAILAQLERRGQP